MTKSRWKELLDSLEIETPMGTLSPIESSTLDNFESEAGIQLPDSYYSFCEVFGAGQIGDRFSIAVPGYQGEAEIFSVQNLQTMMQEREVDEYSSDPEQHKRSLFFGFDMLTTRYFFDPVDRMDSHRCEYGVFAFFRDWEILRLADNFWDFVTEVCLGDRVKEVVTPDGLPQQLFKPVSK